LNLRLEKALERVEHNFGGNLKKRFACSHCGKTWVEIVGSFAVNTEGQDELYFYAGLESEFCQNCKFNRRSCPACGSKDAYEVNFSPDNAQVSPLSFDIRIVSKT
jgi:hypothetical protein